VLIVADNGKGIPEEILDADYVMQRTGQAPEGSIAAEKIKIGFAQGLVKYKNYFLRHQCYQ